MLRSTVDPSFWDSHLPEKPVANSPGLFSLNNGVLWGIVAL